MMSISEAREKAATVSPKELRKFGLLFSALVVAVFYFLFPWIGGRDRPVSVLVAAVPLALAALLLPVALRPVFLAASVVGAVLGAVNNRILLGVIFFLVLTPMALARRVFVRTDPMRRARDPGAVTYRVERTSRDVVKNKGKAF
ncbi:MAG: hypothetical protein HUU37_04860 [Bdellovibrionales bacterium]|nr:hypothetical protein [Bdellovibrionales bacterium]